MKKIPLVKRNKGLYLWVKINGSPKIDFMLDTGCSCIHIAREISDMLFLKGILLESDINSTATGSYGGVFTTHQKGINIRKLSLGKITLKNIQAFICDRYGGPNLLGMSFLDTFENYSISNDALIIDDGKSDNNIITGKVRESKPSKNKFKKSLELLRSIREESGKEDYKFDYTKHINAIYYPIQWCGSLILDNKHSFVIEVLEEMQPIIKENLEDDEKNINQKGAFVSAYFYFYLAIAYYRSERYEEALENFGRAKKFFLPGCTILGEINDLSYKCLDKIAERVKKHPKIYPPAKSTTFEEDVLTYNLKKIDYEDNYYGKGEIKTAYIGFKDFSEAYTFCRMNHKRLEILNKKNGVWQRTGNIPSDDLDYNNIKIEKGFKIYCDINSINKDLKKLIRKLGDDKKKIEQVTEKAEMAKTVLNNEEIESRYYSGLIVRKSDFDYDSIIRPCAYISWHEQEFVLAALDVENFITKKLARDVLSGKIIPSAFGQMPEDYIYLADKTQNLKPYGDEEYTANNDPNRPRMLGPFVLYDEENNVGYGYRATYDDKFWRWEGVEHTNVCGFPNAGDDTSIEKDKQICYWQLVINRASDRNGIVHPEAI